MIPGSAGGWLPLGGRRQGRMQGPLAFSVLIAPGATARNTLMDEVLELMRGPTLARAVPLWQE